MRRFGVFGAAMVAGGLSLLALTGLAGGQVTDYDNYPDPASGAPVGCDASAFSGLSYTAGGQTASSLQDLTGLDGGVEVTVAWTDVAVACGGAPVSLALKSAPGPVFDPLANQPIVLPYATVTAAAGQPGSVSLVLPSLFGAAYEGCHGQLDAVVGEPLAVVGPDGSFYGSALRGDGGPHLLLSAWNGTLATCEPDETTTTTEATTTTTEATTTTTEATTTTAPPSSSAPGSTAAAPAAVVQPGRTLAATGAGVGWKLAVAGMALAGGVATVAASRRRHPNSLRT